MAKTAAGRLAQILNAYGARRERWPARDRLMIGNEVDEPNAAENARELDRVLDRTSIPFPSEKLVSALLDIPARHPNSFWSGSFGTPWQRAAAAVLLLLTGMVAGRLAPMTPQEVTWENGGSDAVIGQLVLGPEMPDMDIE